MKKSLLFTLVALFVSSASYFYVNHQAKQLIAEQIAVMNESYLMLAQEGVMPAVQLKYAAIRANYWRDHYRVSGLTLEVAGLGTLAEMERLSIRGFKPGKLTEQGQVEIRSLRVSNLVQLMLPPEVAKLLAESPLWLTYQYQYQAASGQLLLKQQLRLAQAFHLEMQLQLGEAAALWQFGQQLAVMDVNTQQEYSQSPAYQQALLKSFAQLTLQQGSLTLANTDFLQRLQPVLQSQPVTAPLVALQPQLESYVQSTELVTERVRENLLLFLATPQRLKLSFNLQRPLTWQQLQSGELAQELTTPEQWVAFTGLLVEAN